MPQFDDDAIMRRQGRERAANLLASFFDLDLFARTLSFIFVPFFVERNRTGEIPIPTDVVQAQVGGNAANPRGEFAFEVEGVQTVERADEGLLGEIFGIGAVVQNAVADVEDARLVAGDEAAVGFSVAATGSQDQVAVGGRIHG